MCGLMSDLVMCKFRKSMVIHKDKDKDKDTFIGPQEFVVHMTI